ncbi:MAG: FAD-dependent oxidoreductase, partial [Pygmaiobacter sp.]
YEYGIPVRCGTMVLEITPERIVTAVSKSAGLEQFCAAAIVLAMGCRERPRGALGIPGWRCAGIYTAGTAQKLTNLMGLMPGRRVVILGSGDIGLIMARRMTFLGATVLAVVELMPYSSGLKRNLVQCLDDYDIPLLLEHTVTDIKGKERLSGVCISKVDANGRPIPGTEQELSCDTLLLSVGLIPENELTGLAGAELCPATGGAVVNEQFETSVPGIFSCGNVLHVHDLVDFVTAESMRAGKAAAEYALQGGAAAEKALAVVCGDAVSYTVPQRIRVERVSK